MHKHLKKVYRVSRNGIIKIVLPAIWFVFEKISDIYFFLKRMLGRMMWDLVYPIDIFFSRYRSDNKIFHTWNSPSGFLERKTICIFSHDDPDNLIDDNVLYYLQKLNELNCDIVFLTTGEKNIEERIEKIKLYCKSIIFRKKCGMEFGAYKSGLNHIENNLSKYNNLILANDTVYGPIFDLKSFFELGEKNNLDAWGVTDCWEGGYHLHSYFLFFNRAVFLDKSFQSFWGSAENLYFQYDLKKLYEKDLSRCLQKNGFKLGALCEYQAIKNELLFTKYNPRVNYSVNRKLLRKDTNSSQELWKILIADYACPFVLKSVLLKALKDKNDQDWQMVLFEHTQFDTHHIIEHLKRIS